jgi:hypothetical protein
MVEQRRRSFFVRAMRAPDDALERPDAHVLVGARNTRVRVRKAHGDACPTNGAGAQPTLREVREIELERLRARRQCALPCTRTPRLESCPVFAVRTPCVRGVGVLDVARGALLQALE